MALETLEQKWENERRKRDRIAGERLAESGQVERETAGKTEQVTSTQPQDSSNSYGDAGLEPVIAHKHSNCHLCKDEIDPGDMIVSADGERWVHSECAVMEGWPIA
jgi:hypothetical protein